MELFSQFARYISKITWIPLVVLGVFFLFQVYQLTAFNQYWGYDGGAHWHILETLFLEQRFPTLAENYLSWHEPLYYLLLVAFRFLFVPFWVSHAFLVLVMDVLVFALWRRMGLSRGYALFGSIATLALPAFLEVSMFLTNELLNYVFLFALMHCGLTLWREESWSWKPSLVFALCVGLGLVTKITALIAFGVIVILLAVKMARTRVWKYLFTIFLALVFAVACYAPWYMVRSHGLTQFSVNNYDMLPARAFAWDERMGFMTRFDADIFTFPFWYSGGTGFWSMLYADTVSDYFGLFENQDVKNALPEHERVLTTHNGNSVSAYREPLADWALRLGFVPVGVMLWGMGCGMRGVVMSWRSKRGNQVTVATHAPADEMTRDVLPVLGFFSAFLLALMYYAYRYPYYDQGVVKSIFIAPAFVLPMALGVRHCRGLPKWILGVGGGMWLVYIGVVLLLFFVWS